DYRYMPDPDLPPVILDDDFISGIQKQMPILPNAWRERLEELGLQPPQVETLLEAELEYPDINYLSLIEASLEDKPLAKFLANWFVNLEIPARREDQLKRQTNDQRLTIYTAAHQLYGSGQLSSTHLKTLLTDLLSATDVPKNIEEYAKKSGL